MRMTGKGIITGFRVLLLGAKGKSTLRFALAAFALTGFGDRACCGWEEEVLCNGAKAQREDSKEKF